jgi:superfamily II DNA or RNA helicase
MKTASRKQTSNEVSLGNEEAGSSILSAHERLQLQQLSQLRFWEERSSLDAAQSAETQLEAPTTLPATWTLTRGITLDAWQRDCVDAWFSAERRGVLKVVTGAGKTVLALAVAERLQNSGETELRVAIVVPTIVLVEQWLEEFRTRSNLPGDAVGVMGAGRTDLFNERTRILICVLNSAARKLPAEVSRAGVGSKLLLIIDECHRAGATEARHVLETPRAFSLGLSATPERDTDEGAIPEEDDPRGEQPDGSFDESVLGRALGGVIFELNYADAIRREILPPFRVVHFGLSLNATERDRYERVSNEIKELRSELETTDRRGLALIRWCHSKAGATNPKAQRYLALASRRKRLLYGIESRLTAVKVIVREHAQGRDDGRAILFHENIDDVMNIFSALRAEGFAAVAEHSKFPDTVRAESLRLFREGTARIIVSARSLVEGVNIPSADVGIVIAASASVRQRVQTLGRLLRKSRRSDGTEKDATLFVLYAADTVDELIYEKADWEHLIGAERNEYFVWRDVLGGEPERRPGPPRMFLRGDALIDDATLTPGAPYPGDPDEGKVFSMDSQGTIRDESGNLLFPLPELQQMLAASSRVAGRFRITPSKLFVVKLEKTEGGWQATYLGKLTRPPEIAVGDQSAERETREYVPGDRYPLERVTGRTFSVLQRDKRLVAMKIRGTVRFVLHPKAIDDQRKAVALAAIQERIAAAYAKGHRISKIVVTPEGHVTYVYNNEAYFVGLAPEGSEGFLFESPPSPNGDQQ